MKMEHTLSAPADATGGAVVGGSGRAGERRRGGAAIRKPARHDLHFIKLCVGVETIEELAAMAARPHSRAKKKGKKTPELMHVTRRCPNAPTMNRWRLALLGDQGPDRGASEAFELRAGGAAGTPRCGTRLRRQAGRRRCDAFIAPSRVGAISTRRAPRTCAASRAVPDCRRR